MNIAIILAGGTGSRFGGEEPKQFALVGDKTVLEHSVEAFACVDAVDEICIVSHPNWIGRVRDMFEKRGLATKVIAGGEERFMSSLNAIMAYIDYPDDTNLIFHDAARPCVSGEVINSVIKALHVYEAVGVGVPATDTLWEVAVTSDSMERSPAEPYALLRVPERRRYWMAQTPQAFRLPVVRDAYQRGLQYPMFRPTDDCGVVSRYMPEKKIHLVRGDANNIKITTQHDLDTARSVLVSP